MADCGSSEDFYQKLYNESISNSKRSPLWGTNSRSMIIRIRILQYMNLINIRKLISEEVDTMRVEGRTTAEQMVVIEKLMTRYVSALRDLHFFLERQSDIDGTANMFVELEFIKSGFGVPPVEGIDWQPGVTVPDYSGWKGFTDKTRQVKKQRDDLVKRIFTALAGGLALIAPMLIMRLHPTLLTQLLTASVFILAVGVVLAVTLSHADDAYIAGATAAYAAVLVVFVGASSS